MSTLRRTLLLTVAFFLAGCGLYVPEIQENPLNGPEGQQFVQEIVQNITCEVQDALYDIYTREAAFDPTYQNLKFMNDWGVTLALTLTIDEKGSTNPTFNWLPTSGPTSPSSIFNLNLGATLSSEAQRIDKINSFFLVTELRKTKCDDKLRHQGPFILESDLKLEEWLDDIVQAGVTGYNNLPTNPNAPLKSNVLSHEVKFDIISTGTVTPGWKLKQATINQTGTFLSLTRDRTQDLIITFGPVDLTTVTDQNGRLLKDRHGRVIVHATPSLSASNSLLASEIGVAVSNGVRSALQP
jgi:hypothetical protein